MAIWQFKVILVAGAWLEGGGDVGALGAEPGRDPGAAWSMTEPPGLDARLSGLLPPRKSWQPRLALWGASGRDEIELWRERARIGSINVRFDLRAPNMALLRKIVELAADLGCRIFVPGERRVIASDIDALLKAAGESDAAHFTLDPSSFLSEIDPVNARAT